VERLSQEDDARSGLKKLADEEESPPPRRRRRAAAAAAADDGSGLHNLVTGLAHLTEGVAVADPPRPAPQRKAKPRTKPGQASKRRQEARSSSARPAAKPVTRKSKRSEPAMKPGPEPAAEPTDDFEDGALTSLSGLVQLTDAVAPAPESAAPAQPKMPRQPKSPAEPRSPSASPAQPRRAKLSRTRKAATPKPPGSGGPPGANRHASKHAQVRAHRHRKQTRPDDPLAMLADSIGQDVAGHELAAAAAGSQTVVTNRTARRKPHPKVGTWHASQAKAEHLSQAIGRWMLRGWLVAMIVTIMLPWARTAEPEGVSSLAAPPATALGQAASLVECNFLMAALLVTVALAGLLVSVFAERLSGQKWILAGAAGLLLAFAAAAALTAPGSLAEKLNKGGNAEWEIGGAMAWGAYVGLATAGFALMTAIMGLAVAPSKRHAV
jgi:hypothetical protein